MTLLRFFLLGCLAVLAFLQAWSVVLAVASRPFETGMGNGSTSVAAIVAAANSWPRTGRKFAVVAASLETQARRASGTEVQTRLYCQALSALGQAISFEPWNGRLLAAWSSVRQILGGSNCELPRTQGDYEWAARSAVQSSPGDADVAYFAALIFNFGQRIQDAQALFHSLLRYDVKLNRERRDFIFSQIKDARSLGEILPARFPEVLQFLDYLRSYSPEFNLDREFFGKLEELLGQALKESSAAWKAQRIPALLHRGRMLSLLEYLPAEGVRPLVDRELAGLYRDTGEHELAAFYDLRQSLPSLQFVPGIVRADMRPEKTPVVEWGGTDWIALDDFYSSVAWYLGEGQMIRLVQLCSRSEGASIEPGLFRVLGSDDNIEWQDTGADVALEMLSSDEALCVVMKNKSSAYRYWKVNFNSGRHDRTFRLKPRQDLWLFGETNQHTKGGHGPYVQTRLEEER